MIPFYGGASTAPYQVEGGITNNDWDFFASSGSIKKRISSLTNRAYFTKVLPRLSCILQAMLSGHGSRITI